MDAVLTRMNIRSYSQKAVSQASVRSLLQAAMAADSAGDGRPWHFLVIEDAGIREQMPRMHPFGHIILQAPVAVVVCGDETLQKYPGFWVQDCAAATENILIGAQTIGLGGAWLRIYPVEGRIQSLRKLLALPADVIPFSLVPIGYPLEQNAPNARYDESRVHIDRW